MPSYEITHKQSNTVRLVEARMPSQALAHVAKSDYTVTLASTKRVGELFTQGLVKQAEQAGPQSESVLGGTAA